MKSRGKSPFRQSIYAPLRFNLRWLVIKAEADEPGELRASNGGGDSGETSFSVIGKDADAFEIEAAAGKIRPDRISFRGE